MLLWGPLSLWGPPIHYVPLGPPRKQLKVYFFLPHARPVPVQRRSSTSWFGQWSPDHCREHLRDREESLGKTGKSLCLTTVRLIPSGHSLTGLSLEKPRKSCPKPFVHLGVTPEEDVHGSGLLTRPASATKGLPVLDRRRIPFLPWNLSEEKKKKLVKAGLPHGDDTSEIDRALHPVTRIHKVDGA